MYSLSITEIGSEALIVAVLVASPMLLVALVVGLVIGVVQAATSINEMTLSLSSIMTYYQTQYLGSSTSSHGHAKTSII